MEHWTHEQTFSTACVQPITALQMSDVTAVADDGAPLLMSVGMSRHSSAGTLAEYFDVI